MSAAAARPEEARKALTVGNTNVPSFILRNETAQRCIMPLLPPGVSLSEVAAKVRLAIAKDTRGDLDKCTIGSMILAVARICGWGLEIGVTAHLVPFGDQCTALRDYTGDIELAQRSGMVKHVDAYVVYKNEPFKLIRGVGVEVEHHPIQDPAQRGPMIGVYAIIYLRGGLPPKVEQMTTEEVDAIRQQYSKSWKQGPVPRWYMKKTCIRQGLKLITKSPKMRALLKELDDEEAALMAGELDEQLAVTDGEAPGADATDGQIAVVDRPKALASAPADNPYATTPPSTPQGDQEEAELGL